MACPYYPLDTGYLQNFLAFTDCQARTLGAQGYAALAAPGSIASVSLTAMLTIFVALIGYRMLLGEVPGVRAGVLALVKIGIVLALATGWQGYRTLAYDMLFSAPAQIVGTIGPASGVPGSEGGLVARLDGLNSGFEALAIEGVGSRLDPQLTRVPPPLFNGFDIFAIGAARVIFLVQVMAAFAGLQLLAGLLLALGPFFIGFLLFDATRGLFVGWLRVLVGILLGMAGAMLVFGVQLALFEPWLTDLLAQRAADQPIPGAAAQLLAASTVFALVLAAILAGTGRVAWSLRLPEGVAVRLQERFNLRENSERSTSFQRDDVFMPEERSRAATIVDAIAATQRREAGPAAPGIAAMSRGGMAARVGSASLETGSLREAVAPRRVGTRVSATARRRDRPS
ncbi:type IV secretion system protein [Sphingobium sp. BYY-5]|uniref:type IV secretion system protein n=1 Tax=Sphingobium sp. BYY-5 TaxID=2926400 RepID=UPI001FA6BED6|nr:type IV secretion system protein [Sphingobium sp. BYY-5]MCI4590580.1 type IV secretion system protein [Sphingobium sp. BYY-5]